MRIVLRWLLCIVIPVSIFAAQPWRVDSTKIEGAAQDATGQVWAFGHHPNLGLYRWEGDKWNPVKVTGVNDKAWPWALALGPDGAVYALWSDAAGLLAVSRHHETASKLLVQFNARLRDRPRIFVDPHGDVWITEQGRHIYRVTPQGKADCVYTIADEQFHENGRPKSENWTFNPIYATADGRGRVWFWSDSLAGRADWASLQGVLIFDGAKFEHYPQIAGIPDKTLSVLEPQDAGHMWLAVVDDQLYRIDTTTLAAVPAVPERSFSLFRTVQGISQAGRRTYVVAGSNWQPVPEHKGGGRFCALWQGAGGTWKRLVNGLDMRPETFEQPSRPFLATDEGLWVGSFGSGPWLLWRAAAKLIDWHYGNPIDGSEGLFQLRDGRLLIASRNQGSIAVKPADLPSKTSSDVSTHNPMGELVQDARGHFWGIFAAEDNALSEWDGRSWIEHPITLNFQNEQLWDFKGDSLGRIWILTRAMGPRDRTPRIIAIIPRNLLVGTTIKGFRMFGTDFGTNPVVSTSDPGTVCFQTYASDTQITCDLRVSAAAADGSQTNFDVTSMGYNGADFIEGRGEIRTAIFDPKHNRFETFPTYDQALQAQVPHRADFHLPNTCFLAPMYAPDGRICYHPEWTLVRYFDGERWRQWSTEEILGGRKSELQGLPFFDRAGNLAVHLQDHTWEFANQKGWQMIAPEFGPAPDQGVRQPHFGASPPGCGVEPSNSPVADRLGVFWFTSRCQLYRAIGGQCAPQFKPDEHQPFIDSRELQKALLDPEGNAFLLTSIAPDEQEYVVLKARAPVPKTNLRASVDSWGNVTLSFATKGQGPRGFTWRIDGGPWSTPTQSTEATVDYLSNGTHRVEASAIDERLQIDLTPAVATVEIHIEDATVRTLIQKLGDPDYSVREKALAALLRRPALVLPLLQSAREKAGPDQRWWIDAAIQQVEKSLSTDRRP
jgi:streptogramin lyase